MPRRPPYTANGPKIRLLRYKRRWLQSDLARAVGMSVAQIGRIENGLSVPTLKTVELLAGALDVALDDLIAWDETG